MAKIKATYYCQKCGTCNIPGTDNAKTVENGIPFSKEIVEKKSSHYDILEGKQKIINITEVETGTEIRLKLFQKN